MSSASTRLLTVPEVAERLNTSQRTVGRLYRSGELASIRIRGRQVRIEDTEVNRYIASHRSTH